MSFNNSRSIKINTYFFFARRSSKLDVIRSKFGKILSLVPVDAQVLKTSI